MLLLLKADRLLAAALYLLYRHERVIDVHIQLKKSNIHPKTLLSEENVILKALCRTPR